MGRRHPEPGNISKADIGNSKLRYSPDADVSGDAADSIGFQVYDGTAYSTASYTLTVNVSASNDPPTSTNDSITVNEDSTKNVLAITDFGTFADVDGDSIAGVKITSLESAGNLEYQNADGNWVAVTQNQENLQSRYRQQQAPLFT